MSKRVMIVLLTGLAALGLVNFSIYKKELLLNNGETVFLELAPVDPRSLMQGDYMALRFAIGNDIRTHLKQKENGHQVGTRNGTVVVTLDDRSIAEFTRLGDTEELSTRERILHYRLRNGLVKFATNAFFFQEGTAKVYGKAHYGEFRLGRDGDLLLTGLRDQELVQLGAQRLE